MSELRKVLPLKGHKHIMTRAVFETSCECGWTSCPHAERRYAYSEWREHLLSHGGEYESREKTRAREERAKAKLYAKLGLKAQT